MGAILVSVSLVYVHILTTWCDWRIVQMQQETTKYAMNSVKEIRNLQCYPNEIILYYMSKCLLRYLLTENVVCLMPQLLSSILVAML